MGWPHGLCGAAPNPVDCCPWTGGAPKPLGCIIPGAGAWLKVQAPAEEVGTGAPPKVQALAGAATRSAMATYRKGGRLVLGARLAWWHLNLDMHDMILVCRKTSTPAAGCGE